MPKFHQEYISNYSVRQLYDLVMDIEKYPEFLPWCKDAQITEKNDKEIIADLTIAYKSFSERYSSRISIFPTNLKKALIKVNAINGPFKNLYNEWKFEKNGKKTKINFYVDFEFKSGLLNSLISLFFSKACEKMIAAFESRAGELYKR